MWAGRVLPSEPDERSHLSTGKALHRKRWRAFFVSWQEKVLEAGGERATPWEGDGVALLGRGVLNAIFRRREGAAWPPCQTAGRGDRSGCADFLRRGKEEAAGPARERGGAERDESRGRSRKGPIGFSKTKNGLDFAIQPDVFFSGAAEEIRTPGLQVRSLLLYPAELQPHHEKEV